MMNIMRVKLSNFYTKTSLITASILALVLAITPNSAHAAQKIKAGAACKTLNTEIRAKVNRSLTKPQQ